MPRVGKLEISALADVIFQTIALSPFDPRLGLAMRFSSKVRLFGTC